MPVVERSLKSTLCYCSVSFLLSLLLALVAVRYYAPPNLLGSSRTSSWLEPDLLCSLASGGLALLSAWGAGRGIVRPRAFRILLAHTLCWFGLTIGSFALWSPYLSLLTLLLAPAQAFAVLRLLLLWRAWRAEVAWRAD